MNTFEKAKKIRGVILSQASMVIAYDSWSLKYCVDSMRGIENTIKNKNKDLELFDLDPSELISDELLDLDFGRWSEETNLMLIPLWIYPYVKDGINVEDINGEKFKLDKSKVDTDTRFGCLSFGVIPKIKSSGE